MVIGTTELRVASFMTANAPADSTIVQENVMQIREAHSEKAASLSNTKRKLAAPNYQQIRLCA